MVTHCVLGMVLTLQISNTEKAPIFETLHSGRGVTGWEIYKSPFLLSLDPLDHIHVHVAH